MVFHVNFEELGKANGDMETLQEIYSALLILQYYKSELTFKK